MMQTKTNLKKSWPVEHQDISSIWKLSMLLTNQYVLVFFFIVAIIMTVVFIIIIYK